MLNQILIVVTAYLGLLTGSITSFIAPEELNQGRKYFLLAEKILSIIILALFFYHLKLYWWLSAIILIVIWLVIARYTFKEWIQFTLFAVILGLTKNMILFYTIASLIFIYAMCSAGLYFSRYVKNNKIGNKVKLTSLLLLKNVHFLIIYHLFLLIFSA